jgi:hypothetical protein
MSAPRTPLLPTPAPRTSRGKRVAATALGGTPTTRHSVTAGSRKPFVLPQKKEEDFNLTELINSVEEKIWLLEEMENRPAGNNVLSLMAVGGSIKGKKEMEEELLLRNLPGYRPKKNANNNYGCKYMQFP